MDTTYYLNCRVHLVTFLDAPKEKEKCCDVDMEKLLKFQPKKKFDAKSISEEEVDNVISYLKDI